MKVRELITTLLECGMDDDVLIFVDNQNAHSHLYKVHIGNSDSYRETNTFDVVIEAVDDLQFRKE